MRTVIVEDVETAEAKKQRLATTAVDAALEILRTEASGLVIEAAAPLVFQGLCRRDNIRVEFTQTPMTNGRVIWLGPIDLGHKLASIYVYGHGCHERHHVMYTNFAAMKGSAIPAFATSRTFSRTSAWTSSVQRTTKATFSGDSCSSRRTSRRGRQAGAIRTTLSPHTSSQ